MTVHTAYGSITDIGTQFEVDLRGEEAALGVRVRSGSIRLIAEGVGDVFEASAGELLRMTVSGDFERSSTAVYGEAWAWTLRTSEPFVLDGASLAEYLDWLEAEMGWAIRFESPLDEQEARVIRLSGSSTAGQLADETVSSVLSSAGFSHKLTDGVLWVVGFVLLSGVSRIDPARVLELVFGDDEISDGCAIIGAESDIE